jgi:hypothetical protein
LTIRIEFDATPADIESAEVDGNTATLPPTVSAEAAGGAVERLVTLDQASALVNRKKRSLERYKHHMPPPRVRGRRGQPDEWAWSELRPWLELQFHRILPEQFPYHQPTVRG